VLASLLYDVSPTDPIAFAAVALFLGAVALVAACATGGATSIFPEAGDPDAAVASAERSIADAQQAGADSLAAEIMASARQNLANARMHMQGGNRERAALDAQQAVADAIYARERARRVAAERLQAQAQAALSALPPQGGAR
jgi:hypothetical protein